MKTSYPHIFSLLIIFFSFQSHAMDKPTKIKVYDEKTLESFPILKQTHNDAFNGDIDAVKSAIAKKPSLAHALYIPKYDSFMYGPPATKYKGINVLNPTVKGMYYLYTKHRHSEIVQFLLTLKVDNTLVDEWGESPLHHAAKYGSSDVLEQLLHYNASGINEVNSDGRTPLHLAALCAWERRQAECVISILSLLKYGADLNKQDKEGKTPLLLATEKGHCCIVELLLQNQACCDIADNNKNYPIHQAAKGEYGESSYTLFKLLLQQGNDDLLNKQNTSGRTPLGEIEKGSRTNQYWNSYIQNRYCEKMKVFLQEYLETKQKNT